MTKVLNIQKSIIAVNGNVSLAKELFTMLLDDLNQRSQQIKSSFETSDMESLAEHIHKLYGATAYCIVPILRDTTAVLEDKLRQKDISQLDVLVTSVLDEIQAIMKSGPGYLEEDWISYKVED